MSVHFEFLVEDRSTEAFLDAWLQRRLMNVGTFAIRQFDGKQSMLKKLEARLRGYVRSLPENGKVVVVIDRDSDNCLDLKRRLEEIAARAGLGSRSVAGGPDWRIVNRIAIEELEAWFFGDWSAVCAAFPAVPTSIPRRATYRDPDAIRGGTWEAFERITKEAGYFRGGLQKIAAARAVGAHIDPGRSSSASFRALERVLAEATA